MYFEKASLVIMISFPCLKKNKRKERKKKNPGLEIVDNLMSFTVLSKQW